MASKKHITKPAEQNWFRKYWIEISILLCGLIAMNLIVFADAFRATDTINPLGASQLGDFVGGYIGTFLALVSVVLLSATLKSRSKSAEILSFETKYFELLRLHRDNVAELEVSGISGRQLFVVLIREYRCALDLTKHVASIHNITLTQQQRAHIAYHCLLFGTGPNSSRMLLKSLEEFDNDFVCDLENQLNNEELKNSVRLEKKLTYVPFEGHLSRLGHYYRHLYQSIKYVDQQNINIDKYEYVKTIRAQLSNHEQALLLLNSLSPIGNNWWKHNFMLEYRMVQNIPREFFDPKDELDISSLFSTGYFEWEEVQCAS
ncbi:MAG: putative phage abortive infection protein [Pelodictyon phaeoclathratiforme]|nr:putative phage abortive infection protein [Pelodictyon phaeoclathratiforme]